MLGIKRFISKLDDNPLWQSLMKLVVLATIVTVVMYFLVSFAEIMTIDVSSKKLLGDHGVLSFIFSWRILAIFLLVVLVYRTWRELKEWRALMSTEIFLSWALVIGMTIGGGIPAYLKYAKKQAKHQEQDAREEARVAKAIKTCETFPEEKICKVPLEERDASWTYKVLQCFSDEAEPSTSDLPDECNSFGGKGLEDFILPGSIASDDEFVMPVTPPAILSEQTKQGEAIAKGITPQTVVVAGEVILKKNFAKLVNEIAASHSATGKLPGPSEEGYMESDAGDPIGILIDKHRQSDGTLQPIPAEESEAVFASFLDGQMYPEIKTEIEQAFELKLGLSEHLDTLSDTEKQGVGMLIGVFNHVLRIHEEARIRVKARAQIECAKYPPGTLRPTRCAAFKR